MITFNFENCRFEGIPNRRMELWRDAFPAVNIELDMKRAALWILDNPKKKKKYWGRFLTNWFARTQEKGGNIKGSYRQRLLPIPGKKCSTRHCQMPAVHKSCPGSYDIFHCKNHLPKEVKKDYC